MSIVYWKAGKELNNGKYIVNKVLGSGGFGITYKITEVKTNRSFALKTLNVEAQSRSDFNQLQTKFINEAIVLASCPHPNIVRVYPQVFQEEGLWCMVMEYVEGEDLSRYLEKNGKLEEKKAIAIIIKVGKALVSIHEKGFLHRDIKPANILLRSTDSEPILIDFGLAREFISERSQSMTNLRTESFAPIEQYQRKGRFGAWTDVYALSATLYVLLTARPPLPAKFRAETEYDLTPPQQYEANISDRINEAILKGMEIEPGVRPQSVENWLELMSSTKENLNTFNFDTVKVNNRGQIIKTERHSARYFTEDIGNGISIEMVEIPGGKFRMGSPENELERSKNESPQHEVTVPSFYMGKYEVTQGQWKAVTGLPKIERELEGEPSRFKGEDLPVEQVSWYDAVEFCARLSKATRREYRLPSEAEWEYGCRAGTTTPFHFGETLTLRYLKEADS